MRGVPTIEAADRTPARPVRRGWAALAAVLALAATGVLAAQSVRPPAALAPDAPVAEFSAGRAFAHVRTIAAEPHVAGSAANDAVRAHLLTTLRGLGLSPEVQDTVTAQGARLSSSAGGVGMARVRNVVALWPGTASTGRIFLVAHYDSAQTGPGANDDAAGTAAILEAARALTSGPRLRNDVVFVLTDAEEACLCGAQAFVEQHPLARARGVVLNLEARGSAGPAIMFETAAANAALVGVFAGAPEPVGTSFAVEVYRRLPNNTDFTAFREHGFTGLNSAYIDGAAVYHAPMDTPDSMDIDSLQHHGVNVLALTRDLGNRDLPGLRSTGDATYFPVPGALVHYPSSWTWPLAAAALLAVLVLGWLARRRGMATAPRLLGAFGLALVPVLAVPALAQLLWITIKFIRPGYAEMPIDPYRPWWYRLAILALTAAVVCAWYAPLRRRLGPAALVVAGLAWAAVLGLVLAALAPGGSYLTALPALAGGVAGVAAVLLRGGGRGPLGGWAPVLAVTLGAAAATVVLLPAMLMFFPAMGMNRAAAGAVFAVLLAMVLLPVVDLLHPEAGGQRGLDALRARRRGALPALAATVALVVCTAAGLATDRFDRTHPAPTHLMYALDADTNQARWLSESRTPSAWTAQYVGGDPAPVTDTLPGFGDEKLRSGPALPAALPAPALTKIADTTTGDRRTVTLTLVPQRPVRLVTLHVGAQARVLSATAGARPVPVARTDGAWGFGFVFHAPPAAGIEVTLTVPVGAPLRLRAMDASDGLTALPGFRPRPADVGVVGSHSSEMLAVAKTYTF
ncbi:M20/M25/M40 family metallo-hydrolase [Couchioplanes caeruleus]|uniref:Vacuolar membrane protease n=1 Tax=Couchioplanes caeruleus subsp. caeruleus TaxID=56427 RepID=A0A1K0GP92_9ACTN|nr:M20/M25/M40 family metallo-hydrolase [Couchioplanes caeruleus]OJF11035.1 peptidase [Couchioplanes caeruleus subsp. caeruleus]